MDFIWQEMWHSMMEQKTPPYAPYVMKLILAQDNISGFPNLVAHKPKNLQKKVIEVPEEGDEGDYDDEEGADAMEEDARAAPQWRPRMKMASNAGSLREVPKEVLKKEVKKLSFFKKAMLCMNIDIRKSQYETYKENKMILHNQGLLLEDVPELRGGKTQYDNPFGSSSSDTMSFGGWSKGLVNWKDFDEVTSQDQAEGSSSHRGKQPAVEDEDDEDEIYSEGDDDEDEDE
jgi:hypothetical protein